MQVAATLAALHAVDDPEKAAQAAVYHKAARPYLGVSVPQIETLTRDWRATLSLAARLDLAEALWASNIHEARVAADKLLTHARIRPDDRAWGLICARVPEFDAWAIAGHCCKAGEKRLIPKARSIDLCPASGGD